MAATMTSKRVPQRILVANIATEDQEVRSWRPQLRIVAFIASDKLAKNADNSTLRTPVSSSPVYVSIDVACATGKRLPICFVRPGEPLTPQTRRVTLARRFPRFWVTGRLRSRIHTGDEAHNVAAALNGLARKAGGRPAAQGEAEIMDDVVEPRRPAHPWGKHVTSRRSAKTRPPYRTALP